MRLHHLKIQAFGPFGDVAEVDFDALNDAGQFLISGATGSGKTFILDAVCFALYGEVPGERQRAKHLRSDHAVATAEPRVTLTLTVAERIVRISRSPAWNRPKRRGDGTTPQQASVRLEQQVDGDWLVLATRLDEAGHLISTWLGMTATQFTQVALLPQGGFQTFLHSPTAARQAILQRLFRTDRFERVEKWFGDFRRALNRSRQEALQSIDVLAHLLGEATGVGKPPQIDDGGIDLVAAWSAAQPATVDALRLAAIAEHKKSAETHSIATGQLRSATALSALLDRAEQARAQLNDLDESEGDFSDELVLLRAHERAENLAPLIRTHADALSASNDAVGQVTVALGTIGLDPTHKDELGALVEDAQASLRRAEHASILAAKVEKLREEARSTDEAWQRSLIDLTDLRTAAEALPVEWERVTQQLQTATDAEVRHAVGQVELAAAEQELQAALDLQKVRAELADRQETRGREQTNVQNLREIYQNAREARIEAMASELAVALVVGCSCPVCGSTAHPSPATGVGSVGRKNEERARRAYEDANVALTALDEVIAGLRARARTLASLSREQSADSVAAQVSVLQERQASFSAQLATIADLRDRTAVLRRQIDAAQSSIEKSVQREAQAHAQADLIAGQLAKANTELTEAMGHYADAATFGAHARECSERVLNAVSAIRSQEEAARFLSQQTVALDTQARALGFASGEDATAALMPIESAETIARRERERGATRLAAVTVLEDPDVLASLGSPRPDLEALRLLAVAKDEELANALATLRIAERRAERTHAIFAELNAAFSAYRPLEAKAEQVTALSGLLEGTGADNRLRMRLSAFVLAERLRQVIAAANTRLEAISEGRYVLNYQEQRGAGDNRGGLSLSVLDEWTGIRRDPTTLSGGETFVVSLCLALGLADTVADESGGLRIDTLFIDEGFGSLDAQTLDSVIDILSQLSQGGRVTGVVSHVQELRERLPAVLEVVPSKSGSTVRRASA